MVDVDGQEDPRRLTTIMCYYKLLDRASFPWSAVRPSGKRPGPHARRVPEQGRQHLHGPHSGSTMMVTELMAPLINRTEVVQKKAVWVIIARCVNGENDTVYFNQRPPTPVITALVYVNPLG